MYWSQWTICSVQVAMETTLLNAKKKKSVLETKYYSLPVTKCSLNKLKSSAFWCFCIILQAWRLISRFQYHHGTVWSQAYKRKLSTWFLPMKTTAKWARKISINSICIFNLECQRTVVCSSFYQHYLALLSDNVCMRGDWTVKVRWNLCVSIFPVFEPEVVPAAVVGRTGHDYSSVRTWLRGRWAQASYWRFKWQWQDRSSRCATFMLHWILLQ